MWRKKKSVFLPRLFETPNMAVVAQLVRVPDCGSVGRRFESDLPPEEKKQQIAAFFALHRNRYEKNDERDTKPALAYRHGDLHPRCGSAAQLRCL